MSDNRVAQWEAYLWLIPQRALNVLVQRGPSVAEVREKGAESLVAIRGLGTVSAAAVVAAVATDTHFGRVLWAPSLGRWLGVAVCGLWCARIASRPTDGTMDRGRLYALTPAAAMCPVCQRGGVTFERHTEGSGVHQQWKASAVAKICRDKMPESEAPNAQTARKEDRSILPGSRREQPGKGRTRDEEGSRGRPSEAHRGGGPGRSEGGRQGDQEGRRQGQGEESGEEGSQAEEVAALVSSLADIIQDSVKAIVELVEADKFDEAVAKSHATALVVSAIVAAASSGEA